MMGAVDVKSSSGAYTFTAGSSILDKELTDLKNRENYDAVSY